MPQFLASVSLAYAVAEITLSEQRRCLTRDVDPKRSLRKRSCEMHLVKMIRSHLDRIILVIGMIYTGLNCTAFKFRTLDLRGVIAVVVQTTFERDHLLEACTVAMAMA